MLDLQNTTCIAGGKKKNYLKLQLTVADMKIRSPHSAILANLLKCPGEERELNLIQNYLIYYQQSPNFTHTFRT